MDMLKANISEILAQNIKFWQLLKQSLVVLDDLMLINEEIKEKIKQCNRLWKKMINFLGQKKKWRFYYAWY
jgi:hypothetical protein